MKTPSLSRGGVITLMSKGPGLIERRIAELFAETRDRALLVEDICDRAFALKGGLASARSGYLRPERRIVCFVGYARLPKRGANC